jgi:hypothetical protein
MVFEDLVSEARGLRLDGGGLSEECCGVSWG